MSRRRGPGNQEHPDVIVHSVPFVMLSPTQVVEGVLGRKTQFTPKPVSDQAVQAGAFIHFVEMRQGFICKEDAASLRVPDWRTIHVVQQAFRQIAGRSEEHTSELQ